MNMEFFVTRGFTHAGTRYVYGDTIDLSGAEEELIQRLMATGRISGGSTGSFNDGLGADIDPLWVFTKEGTLSMSSRLRLTAHAIQATYLEPFPGREIDQIAMRFAVAGDEGMDVRVGAYTDDGGIPGELIADFGVKDIGVEGVGVHVYDEGDSFSAANGCFLAALLTPPEGVGVGGVEPEVSRHSGYAPARQFPLDQDPPVTNMFDGYYKFPMWTVGASNNTGLLPSSWDISPAVAFHQRSSQDTPVFAARLRTA